MRITEGASSRTRHATEGADNRAGRLARARGLVAVGGAVAGLAALAALTLGGSPARATFPGENGRLLCEGQRGPALPEPNLEGESRTEVFAINPDGTGETVLTDNRVRDGDPSFSPDGENIAFESFRDGFSEAYRAAADGSSPVRLTTSGDNEDRSTNWSPDGTKIAFHSTRDMMLPTASPFEIYVMNADGSNQTRITNNTFQDSFPQWSPDGARLTFTSNRDGDFEIYTMKPDGTDVQRVTTSVGEDAHSTWSPDGTQLTFHSRRSGVIDIYRMNADGSGEATRLTNTEEAFEFFPVWSPDGTRIAFNGTSDAEPDDTEVYHVNAVDGTDLRRVTNATGFDGRCDWEAVQPEPEPEPDPDPDPDPEPEPDPDPDPAPPGDDDDGDDDAGRVRPNLIRPSFARAVQRGGGARPRRGRSRRGSRRGGSQRSRQRSRASGRQRGRRRSGGRIVVTLRGRMRGNRGRACGGRLKVGTRVGRRRVSQRQARMASNCRYTVRYSFPVRRLPPRLRPRNRPLVVRVKLRFQGNSLLRSDLSPTRRIKVRR